jgi:hypothetical protein
MRTATRLAAIATCVVAASLIVAAQQSKPGVHPVSGRVYAQPMSYLGADWLDRNERVNEEEPDIADLVGKQRRPSAETTVRLLNGQDGQPRRPDRQSLRKRHPAGKRDPLRQRLAKEHVTNVETVLGTTNDPRPPPGRSISSCWWTSTTSSGTAVDVASMREALKPGGRLVLLSYRKEDPSVPIKPDHR